MIILHAGRVGKKFFLWDESPAENETPVVRRGRKPKIPTVKPHLYDSGVENLSPESHRTLNSFVSLSFPESRSGLSFRNILSGAKALH